MASTQRTSGSLIRNRDGADLHPSQSTLLDDETEATPLLPQQRRDVELGEPDARRKNLWTMITITVLLVITLNIIAFAFIIPSAAQTYGNQATTFSLQNVQIEDFTDDNIIANVQVNVTVDASRVNSSSVRNIGLFGTRMFKHVYTSPCDVTVYLPQYGGGQVAIVAIPALKVDVRNQHINLLDVLSNVTITNETIAVQLASDVLAGIRHEIETIGETDVNMRIGVIPLGKHHVRQEVVIQGR
jgi:hypothetical protein